jgi:hypothetical protein
LRDSTGALSLQLKNDNWYTYGIEAIVLSSKVRYMLDNNLFSYKFDYPDVYAYLHGQEPFENATSNTIVYYSQYAKKLKHEDIIYVPYETIDVNLNAPVYYILGIDIIQEDLEDKTGSNTKIHSIYEVLQDLYFKLKLIYPEGVPLEQLKELINSKGVLKKFSLDDDILW